MFRVTFPTVQHRGPGRPVSVEYGTLEAALEGMRDEVPAVYRPFACIADQSGFLDIDGKTRITPLEQSNRLHFRASSEFAPGYEGHGRPTK